MSSHNWNVIVEALMICQFLSRILDAIGRFKDVWLFQPKIRFYRNFITSRYKKNFGKTTRLKMSRIFILHYSIWKKLVIHWEKRMWIGIPILLPHRFHKVLSLREYLAWFRLPHRESFVDTSNFYNLMSR